MISPIILVSTKHSYWAPFVEGSVMILPVMIPLVTVFGSLYLLLYRQEIIDTEWQ